MVSQYLRSSSVSTMMSPQLLLPTLLALLASQAAAQAYSEAFSLRVGTNFSGGTYKASNSLTFPGSPNISGALVHLNAGGLREQHWHQPNEWGVVIQGACQATLVQSGATRPSESWTFNSSSYDSWFFPSNDVHAIVGLAPDGCTYLTGYDAGPFDELYDSSDISAWISATPASIVAQAFGVNQADVEAYIPSAVNGFITQGNLTALTANQGLPPLLALQAAPLASSASLVSHRIALGSAISPSVNNAGAVIRTADSTNFPGATNMASTLVKFAPYGLRQLHWHPLEDEWQYSVNATVVVGVFNQTTQEVEEYLLAPGDIGNVPKGLGHYIKEVGGQTGYLVAIYNNGVFTSIEAGTTIGGFPLEYFRTAIGAPASFVSSLNISGSLGAVPGSQGVYNASEAEGVGVATQPVDSAATPSVGPQTLATAG